jgi:phospho-N-acetylmuramoyl-pentapeptide-transferase
MKEATLAMSLATLSFILTVIWGGPLLRILRHYRIGKVIRVEAPDRHSTKMGTPTMGGVMFIAPVLLLTILLNFAPLLGLTGVGQSVLLPMLVMVAYGVLGAIDDWEGIRGRRRGQGMRARTKLLIQIILAVGIGFALKFLLDVKDMYLPGIQGEIHLGNALYILITVFLVVGSSNAVNLTDGLDGLAGLVSATIFAAFAVIALFQHQVYLARFGFTVVGALFGFLWFNVHPAELFMGDTGSLPLGAAIAVVALMTGQWPMLAIIGIIPVSVALSDILQVAFFRITGGRRLFKLAPIHHHFELIGWSETQVVQRFWLIGLLAAMIGVGLAMV